MANLNTPPADPPLAVYSSAFDRGKCRTSLQTRRAAVAIGIGRTSQKRQQGDEEAGTDQSAIDRTFVLRADCGRPSLQSTAIWRRRAGRRWGGTVSAGLHLLSFCRATSKRRGERRCPGGRYHRVAHLMRLRSPARETLPRCLLSWRADWIRAVPAESIRRGEIDRRRNGGEELSTCPG